MDLSRARLSCNVIDLRDVDTTALSFRLGSSLGFEWLLRASLPVSECDEHVSDIHALFVGNKISITGAKTSSINFEAELESVRKTFVLGTPN